MLRADFILDEALLTALDTLVDFHLPDVLVLGIRRVSAIKIIQISDYILINVPVL